MSSRYNTFSAIADRLGWRAVFGCLGGAVAVLFLGSIASDGGFFRIGYQGRINGQTYSGSDATFLANASIVVAALIVLVALLMAGTLIWRRLKG